MGLVYDGGMGMGAGVCGDDMSRDGLTSGRRNRVGFSGKVRVGQYCRYRERLNLSKDVRSRYE